jgi:RNA polymerase sigma factor for flagellar operon FliA
MGDRQTPEQLWREYRRTGARQTRNALVVALTPLVRQIVASRTRLLPAQCEPDDCLSCGMEALIRSIDRFDPERGTSLEQFVWTRVDGAVLDEARRRDWAPRSVRRFARTRARAEANLFVEHGRTPTPFELACALEMTPDELRHQDGRLANADLVSLNAPAGHESEEGFAEVVDLLPSQDRDTHPELAVMASEAHHRVRDVLATLSPRERTVAHLLYEEDLTMRETGEHLGVTESRVSQLNARVKRQVREALEADADLALAA